MNLRGTATSSWSGRDLSVQKGVESDAWYAPSMYNVVKRNGHLVVRPDVDCAVNGGLGCLRGARTEDIHIGRPRKTLHWQGGANRLSTLRGPACARGGVCRQLRALGFRRHSFAPK